LPPALLPGAGGSLFAIIVAWLHVRRPEIDPATTGVSQYATGSTYLPMTVAFVALAIGFASVPTRVASTTVSVCCWLASIGIFVVAIVPVSENRQPGWRVLAHTAGALLFFVSAPWAAIAATSGSTDVAMVVAWLLAAAVVLFFASMARVPALFPIRGWLQRFCFALVVVWLIVAGMQGLSAGDR